jgi:hypothetical protein
VNAVRAVVGGVGEILVTAGALVLLFLAWQLWWTDVVADRAQDRTTEALLEQWDAAGAGELPGEDGDPAPVPPGGSPSPRSRSHRPGRASRTRSSRLPRWPSCRPGPWRCCACPPSVRGGCARCWRARAPRSSSRASATTRVPRCRARWATSPSPGTAPRTAPRSAPSPTWWRGTLSSWRRPPSSTSTG